MGPIDYGQLAQRLMSGAQLVADDPFSRRDAVNPLMGLEGAGGPRQGGWSARFKDTPHGYEARLVDGSGKTHYKASVARPNPKTDDIQGYQSLNYIENVSRQYKGLGPTFYRALATKANKQGETLIVGPSASPSAVRAHDTMLKAGTARPMANPDAIRPGLSAEARAANERLLEVLPLLNPKWK